MRKSVAAVALAVAMLSSLSIASANGPRQGAVVQQQAPTQQQVRNQVSAQRARAAVVRRLRSEGRSSDVTVRTLSRTATGQARVLVQNRDTNRVESGRVNHHGTYTRGPVGDAVEPGQAIQIANRVLRRERNTTRGGAGTFSGTNMGPMTERSYRVNSASDRNETVFVRFTNGRTYRRDR